MGHARRTITILTAAVTAALSLAGVSTADAAPTPSPAAAANASQNVIVVLRDQLASTPASKHDMSPRRARATSAQDAVLSRLTGTAPTHVKHFALGNAFSATVSEAQAAALAQDPQVASVIPDRTVAIAQPAPAAFLDHEAGGGRPARERERSVRSVPVRSGAAAGRARGAAIDPRIDD